MTRFVLLVIAVALSGSAGRGAAESIAIVGARVHVRPGEVLEGATVIVDRGRITAVGVGVAAPAGARVIDGRGKRVTAGLIEAMSGVGLVGIELEARSVDGRFAPIDPVHADAVHAGYQAQDGFDPGAVTIAVARSGGVTLVVAAPQGGLVGGQGAAYTLDGATTPVRAPAAMHAELGPGGAGAVGGSRGKAIEVLRELLEDARVYGRDPSSYERNQRRKMIADRLDLEALQPVLRGAVPLVVTAHSEPDIRAAVRLAQVYKLRLVISGGAEAWRVAKVLAASQVAVILDPTANLPEHIDATDVRDDRATILARAGVSVAVSTLGDAPVARTIRQLAGVAVGEGLSWDQALAAVTTVPAEVHGLGGATGRGTVTKGAIADLVVWNGDPFELLTAAEVIIIGGVVQPNDSHQTRLLERYRTLPLQR